MTSTLTRSLEKLESGVPGFIAEWFAALQPLLLDEVAADPASIGLFSADMVVGFCDSGNLASPRIDALTGPVVDLFSRAHDLGAREFVLMQDTHDPATPEFEAWPVHCVADTEESETIPEMAELPFSGLFTVIPKNALGPGYGTTFDAWLDAHPEITNAIVVGDCTDLCTYNLAMHLRMRANALNIPGVSVIVPANAVDTYDLPGDTAQAIGAFTHPGDFFHQTFLYHMALNGIRVVRELT
jgi:nicotinamidase-related amidase